MTDPDLDRIFKAYDVRGVVPDELDASIARRIGAAFAVWANLPAIAARPRLPDILARARRGHHGRCDVGGRERRSTSVSPPRTSCTSPAVRSISRP